MDEMDPKLDERLALLRHIAEPAHADKGRLLAALRTNIRASSNAASEPLLRDGAHAVGSNGRRWISDRNPRPLVSWLGGACIGAIITLVIGSVWNPLPGARVRGPAASGSAPNAPAAHENTITTGTGTGRVVSRVGVSASDAHAASADGTAGSLDISRAATAMPSAAPAPGAELGLTGVLEQLHRAERALYAGEVARALGILSDLDTRAEPALLREERLTTLVLALCQADRVEEALEARRQLEREIPSSIYARRLDQSCAVELNPR